MCLTASKLNILSSYRASQSQRNALTAVRYQLLSMSCARHERHPQVACKVVWKPLGKTEVRSAHLAWEAGKGYADSALLVPTKLRHCSSKYSAVTVKIYQF